MLRFLRTVRHLRPSQLLWRLRYDRERRRNLRHGTTGGRWRWTEPAPSAVSDDLPAVPVFHHPGTTGSDLLRGLRRGVVELLDQELEIGHEVPDWRLGRRRDELLPTVTLHYHSWLHALAAAAKGSGDEAEEAARLFRHYLADWLRRCRLEEPGSAQLAWSPYAVATRLGWWARTFREARARVFDPQPELAAEFFLSLWEQADYLRDHLEWDLGANHLLRNLTGLAWAGRLFRGTGEKPREWLRTAARLACVQVAEQVLADGGQYERSPTYHLEVMSDLLALVLLLDDPQARERLRQGWAAMAEYLAWVRHPDGAIPLLNDAALGAACPAARMLELGTTIGVDVDPRPRRGGKHFPSSGLVVWHGDPWTLFLDLGPVGPDHQPGHAHADTLSLEASFEGRRLFVDPGTFAYDDDERRRYDRSTEAHNTVAVDGVDSSEVWRIFRVGRRARPRAVRVALGPHGLEAAAGHDGYDHLPGRPRHHRRVTIADGALTVIDRIDGRGRHEVRGGFLVAPEWRVEPVAGGWELQDGTPRVVVTVTSDGDPQPFMAERPYHPRFGVELRATRIGWQWEGRLPLEVRTIAAPG